MDVMLELMGLWLARLYAFYGVVFLLIPTLTFLYVPLMIVMIWNAIARKRGREPFRSVPAAFRRWTRLGMEITFGLINPAIYLAIFTASMPAMQRDVDAWWFAPLATTAWLLLAAFWMTRIFGGALSWQSRAMRLSIRALLVAAFACVLIHAVKDARMLADITAGQSTPVSLFGFISIALRVSPLYLIPMVLLLDHLRATTESDDLRERGFFLLRDRSARLVAVSIVVVGVASSALALHRSSEGTVRTLVRDHRASIIAAAARHDVDPKLMASIVYVTHRDQLSPFRGALERLIVSVWIRGYWPEAGANETLLNRPLDVSVGLAQIKPRTAQTALLLANGEQVHHVIGAPAGAWRDSEPTGDAWTLPPTGAPLPPEPTLANRQALARTLLDPSTNLETCALILSLYQRQWESANAAWSLRQRPDILATLYQIGFARSKPHAAPRSNDFGRRVREVYDQPWLSALFASPAPEERGL
jgi:hypothetical protein